MIQIKKGLEHNENQGHDLIEIKVIHSCPGMFVTNLSKIYNWGIGNGKYLDKLKLLE